MQKKHICILVPVYNELDNIEELYARLTSVMGTLTQYTYEIRVIDNCSTDGTREKIQEICAKDNRFKAIFNIRNFGAIRSPIHNLYNADGDAAISLCADLQDPPELIVQFLEKWEAGYKLVMGGTDLNTGKRTLSFPAGALLQLPQIPVRCGTTALQHRIRAV